jgi:hypothetical protein
MFKQILQGKKYTAANHISMNQAVGLDIVSVNIHANEAATVGIATKCEGLIADSQEEE